MVWRITARCKAPEVVGALTAQMVEQGIDDAIQQSLLGLVARFTDGVDVEAMIEVQATAFTIVPNRVGLNLQIG